MKLEYSVFFTLPETGLSTLHTVYYYRCGPSVSMGKQTQRIPELSGSQNVCELTAYCISMSETVVRSNGSRGIQTHWSADIQAFVVSWWEKEKHYGVQAASICVLLCAYKCSILPVSQFLSQVLIFPKVCNGENCSCIWLARNSFHLYLNNWQKESVCDDTVSIK